jgi:hypothetical protein
MTLTTRLARLQKIWPRRPCAECRARPALLCVDGDGDEPVPVYPEGICDRCGRFRPSILVILADKSVCDRI